jgi:hypothetical protein
MSLGRFFNSMTQWLPHSVLSLDEARKLSELDPQKIYIENVRSLLGVSYDRAHKICEAAVRQGFFTRGIEVLCPNGDVAVAVEGDAPLPATVLCWEQADDGPEQIERPTSGLRKLPYYKLNEGRASQLYEATA